MYPLLEIGPLRLSSGGLALLAALVIWNWRFERIAARRSGSIVQAQAGALAIPMLAGAVIGGRVTYGLFNLDFYGAMPGLFLAFRIGDLAWPGAMLGAILAGWAFCRWRRFDPLPLADAAALALPAALTVGYAGALLSGEAFGLATSLPWGVPLFGAMRHPTQLYAAGAALLVGALLTLIERRVPDLPPGGLALAFLGFHGLALLLVEALRADSLSFPGGIRATQVFGLGLIIIALALLRRPQSQHPSRLPQTDPK
jgi:phosphatidylglycerol:prolipoprotein diacylglycerol transferase